MKTLTIPLALDPKNLDRHYVREPILRNKVSDAELDTLRGALATAHEAAAAIIDAREAISADQTRTPRARAVAIRKLALRRGELAASKLDAAREKVGRARDTLAAEIGAPPVPMHQAHLAPEVRARLAGMSEGARARVLDHAVRHGDDLTVASYLSAPAYVSGAGEADQQTFRLRWQTSTHPAQLDRINRMGKALEAVERAGKGLVGLVETVANDPSAAMGERAKAVADKVEAESDAT